MFGIRKEEREDQKWLAAARQTYESGENPLVDVAFRAVVSRSGSSLAVSDPEGRICQVTGPMPEEARNVALEPAALAQRLSKTGGTPFRCVEVRTQVEPGLTLSAAAINAMRRDALNQLLAVRARREQPVIGRPMKYKEYPDPKGMPGLTIQITSADQLTQKMLKMESLLLYVPIHILAGDRTLAERLAQRGRVAVALPRIVHDGEMNRIRNQLNQLRTLGFTDALVGNLGLIGPVRDAGMR